HRATPTRRASAAHSSTIQIKRHRTGRFGATGTTNRGDFASTTCGARATHPRCDGELPRHDQLAGYDNLSLGIATLQGMVRRASAACLSRRSRAWDDVHNPEWREAFATPAALRIVERPCQRNH